MRAVNTFVRSTASCIQFVVVLEREAFVAASPHTRVLGTARPPTSGTREEDHFVVACARHTARARAIQIEHALRFHLLFVTAMIASAVAALSASATAQTSSPQYSASLGSAGVEAMWQVPSGAPHSILFLAHGCNHQGTDFWHASAVCNKCLGLPEEVRIVKAALAANFAVIAVTSIDRDSGCWTFEADAPRVRDAIAAFRTAAGLPGSLPIVALGASSGGAFALQLPAVVPCMAVVSQIMAIPPNMLPATMPPTLFVHMPRDQRTASYVHKDVRKLRQAGVAAHALEVHAQRPSKEFFLERIERLTPAAAASLHAALDKAGLLDKHGFLRDDPRRSDWRGAILERWPRAAAARRQPRWRRVRHLRSTQRRLGNA